MSDQQNIAVRQSDIDAMQMFIRNRLRQLVLEHMHNYDPGAITGMMSDLRALTSMVPTDRKPAPVKQKAGSRDEHDIAMRAQNKAHDDAERMRLATE